MKNEPKRTCIGCNQIKLKKELIRIVKDKQGNINVDKTGKANGRGAYICDNKECLEKSKRLEKTFEMNIDKKLYEEIESVLK